MKQCRSKHDNIAALFTPVIDPRSIQPHGALGRSSGKEGNGYAAITWCKREGGCAVQVTDMTAHGNLANSAYCSMGT